MLLGFLFTFLFFLFLEAQAIMMPIALAFSKARLKTSLVNQGYTCIHIYIKTIHFRYNNNKYILINMFKLIMQ